MSERRQSLRRRCDAYASINGVSQDLRGAHAFCAVLDVSDGGIRLHSPLAPDVGALVELRIAVEEEIHCVAAFVVHVQMTDSSLAEVRLGFLEDGQKIEDLLISLGVRQGQTVSVFF